MKNFSDNGSMEQACRVRWCGNGAGKVEKVIGYTTAEATHSLECSMAREVGISPDSVPTRDIPDIKYELGFTWRARVQSIYGIPVVFQKTASSSHAPNSGIPGMVAVKQIERETPKQLCT